MCVCAFLGMKSPRIGLILVLEGVVFHFIWFKCLFETVTIYSDKLFEHICLKMQKLRIKKIKKNTPDPYFQIFWVGRKRANRHIYFFKPNKPNILNGYEMSKRSKIVYTALK